MYKLTNEHIILSTKTVVNKDYWVDYCEINDGNLLHCIKDNCHKTIALKECEIIELLLVQRDVQKTFFLEYEDYILNDLKEIEECQIK